MNQELLQAVQFLKTEKGLPADVIFESLEAVLLSAYKRETGTHAEATATIDRETGVYHIFVTKTWWKTSKIRNWKFRSRMRRH